MGLLSKAIKLAFFSEDTAKDFNVEVRCCGCRKVIGYAQCLTIEGMERVTYFGPGKMLCPECRK